MIELSASKALKDSTHRTDLQDRRVCCARAAQGSMHGKGLTLLFSDSTLAETCRGPMREKLHCPKMPSRVSSEMSAWEYQKSTAPLLSSTGSVQAFPASKAWHRQFPSSGPASCAPHAWPLVDYEKSTAPLMVVCACMSQSGLAWRSNTDKDGTYAPAWDCSARRGHTECHGRLCGPFHGVRFPA